MPYSVDAWDVHDMSLNSFYHGPLADVDGVMRVRVGRMVENQEEAVFIIGESTFLSSLFPIG